MNSKSGTTLSTLIIIVGIAIGSASVLAAEPVSLVSPETAADDTSIDGTATRLANSANEEAVREAARSIQTHNKLDLDIRLIGPTSVRLAAK